MVRFVLLTGLVEAALGSYVDLTADDGFDPRLLGLGVELNGSIHGSVVGQGDCPHPHLFYFSNQFFDTDGTV